MNFGAVHADRGWRTDSEADFVSRDRQHRDGYLIIDHNLFTDPPCQNQHGRASLLGGDSRTDIVPHQDRAVGITETNRVRIARSGAAMQLSLLCWATSFSRTSSAKENGVWDGIVVLVRTRKNVLLRTLDVRQIRRTVLGMRKAPGMKSNCGKVYTNSIEASSPHDALTGL